eukprot:6671442-Karenia_brevis.AAC.1
MALESHAVFASRLAALGLEAQLIDVIKGKGWGTLGAFAFSSSYTPGQPDDAKFIADVVVPVLGDANHPQKSVLRRAYYEAFTMEAADLRRKVDRSDDDPPRKMPAPERAARLDKLQATYPTLQLQGQLECSYQ